MLHLRRISVKEVFPRDGLQNNPEFLGLVRRDAETAITHRIRMVELLAAAGAPLLEVCAFTGSALVAMAQPNLVLSRAIDFVSQLKNQPELSGLVFSTAAHPMVYVERAIGAGLLRGALVMSAHPEHCQANTGAFPQELLARYSGILNHPLVQQSGICFSAYLSTCWGHRTTDDVSLEEVYRLTQQLLELDVVEVTWSDTAAHGTAETIFARITALGQRGIDLGRIGFHAHDPDWRQGVGVANILAAIEAGIHRVDSSLLGLGGCPATDHAHGNVATEDLVQALHQSGNNTGIKMDQLRLAADHAVRQMRLPVCGHVFNDWDFQHAGPKDSAPSSEISERTF